MHKKNSVKVFDHTSAIVMAFSMLTFTVLVLIKTLVTVFNASVINQFKSIYYLTNYSSSNVSLISGIFGGTVTLSLSLAIFGLFFSIIAESKENVAKVMTGIKLIRFSAILGLIVSIITAVCSVASVSVVNYYAVKASSFQQTVQNNSWRLLFSSLVFGAVSVIFEVAVIRFLMAMENYLKGNELRRKGVGLIGFVSGMGAVTAAIVFVSLLYDIITVNYKSESFSPFSLTSDILNLLISVSLIVFFISLMMSVYNYSYYSKIFMDDEYEYFYDYFDDTQWDEEKEVRVFSEDESHIIEDYSKPKQFILTFDIPHTEYPE